MANSLLNSNGTLNIKNYNEKVNKQNEIFSEIDSKMAILEKLPYFADTALDFLKNGFTLSPLGFIFRILKSLGVDEETLKEWIVELLVNVLPAVETGVKASLLSNVKSLISCNSDPRIPLRFRKRVSDSVYTNILTSDTTNMRGIDINIDAIDPQRILDLSPFTDPGKEYYFGCEEDYSSNEEMTTVIGDGNSRTAKLARADDFNAFLWYVIHKGNKQNPSRVTINENIFTVEGDDLNYTITSGNLGLLGTIEIKAPEGTESNIVAGNTFYDANNANYISVCIESKVDDNGIVTGNTIVPVSSDWFSCNWYVDKTNYYSSNLGFKQKSKRNYSEEKAICNLRFCEPYDYLGKVIPDSPHNIRFTILPKPYVLLPSIDLTDNGANVQFKPIRLMFNPDGTPNQKGKFSLISETYDLQPTLVNKRTQGNYTLYDVKGIEEDGVHTIGATLYVDTKTGKYELRNITNLTSILVECYPGLTIYEFNYDYIMGMKLFDPKVVCQRIFDNAANPEYNALFKLTLNKTKKSASNYPFIEGVQQVSEIVKTILEEDDDEINDCFFTFSNEQYDEMLKKTEEIRYRQLPYNQGYNNGETIDFVEVTKILETYPENGSIDEQKAVISKALTKACEILNERKNVTTQTDKSTTNIDFLTNVLQNLVASIVNAVLSPKVLMMLAVNKAMMQGDDEEFFSAKALLKIMKSVIKSVIKEIRDLIIKKLLDYIIKYLTPLILEIQAKIFSEQFAAYIAIIKYLLSWYNMGTEIVSRASSLVDSLSSKVNEFSDLFGGSDKYGRVNATELSTIIDNLTYADIYPNDDKNNVPINKNC